MKRMNVRSVVVIASVLLFSCTESLDPLSPGSGAGEYALGVKGLIPLVIGNHWTYNAAVYDTSGMEISRSVYTVTVADTAFADTSIIPLPSSQKLSSKRSAFVWYVLRGEGGSVMLWQADTLENLRIRTANDAKFLEQTSFEFRASVNDTSASRSTGTDINVWGIVDTLISNDVVRTVLVSKGTDSLRTTLGSAQYFHYRQLYTRRPHYTDYFFKPGFGLMMLERYARKQDGTPVCVRRDQLVSYYFQ
jgi:hypothetical protein